MTDFLVRYERTSVRHECLSGSGSSVHRRAVEESRACCDNKIVPADTREGYEMTKKWFVVAVMVAGCSDETVGDSHPNGDQGLPARA